LSFGTVQVSAKGMSTSASTRRSGEKPSFLDCGTGVSPWSGEAHLAECGTVPPNRAAGGKLSDKVELYINHVDRYIKQAERYSTGPDLDQTAYYLGRD
jgi:hypothetical protein